MNYLAHAYLSFSEPEVLVGNMISDFVKGRKKFDYPPAILDGIMLHRMIDGYTDDHPATREAKEFFRPDYRLYSGAFIDVVYDHYLANDRSVFPDESSLQRFSTEVYETLGQYTQWLPPAFAAMFPYMRSHDWLYNYRTRAGIAKSFQGLVRRSAYLGESATAEKLLVTHIQPLQNCYRLFWQDVKMYAKAELENLKLARGT